MPTVAQLEAEYAANRTRDYKKCAEIEGQKIIVTGIEQIGASTFENTRGQPLLTLAIMRHPSEGEGASGPWVADKLLISSQYLVPRFLYLFDHFPEVELKVRLNKRPLPGSPNAVWQMEDWGDDIDKPLPF